MRRFNGHVLQPVLEEAEKVCASSVPNYLEEPPPFRPVAAPAHAFVFNDSLLADLWFVPGGGKSEFILHFHDEAPTRLTDAHTCTHT